MFVVLFGAVGRAVQGTPCKKDSVIKVPYALGISVFERRYRAVSGLFQQAPLLLSFLSRGSKKLVKLVGRQPTKFLGSSAVAHGAIGFHHLVPVLRFCLASDCALQCFSEPKQLLRQRLVRPLLEMIPRIVISNCFLDLTRGVIVACSSVWFWKNLLSWLVGNQPSLLVYFGLLSLL